jgi:hypothetical protein
MTEIKFVRNFRADARIPLFVVLRSAGRGGRTERPCGAIGCSRSARAGTAGSNGAMLSGKLERDVALRDQASGVIDEMRADFARLKFGQILVDFGDDAGV